MRQLRVHERGLGIELIAVATTLSFDSNLPCVFQVAQDLHHSAFGEANLARDLPNSGLRVQRYIEQNQTMTGD